MPYGFIGQASRKYFTAVSDALSSAAEVHNRNPYSGSYSKTTPPPISARKNYSPKYPPDTAMSGGYPLGVGNHTNVVVDQVMYDETLQKIQIVNAKIAEELYNVAGQIEQMCETIYIVPSTLPKYLELVGKVKTSLDEFQTLVEEARICTYEFTQEILRIDSK